MYNEVIFDVETKKLFSDIEDDDPGKLGVSIVSLYQRVIDENFKEVRGGVRSFWEKDFSSMWPIFQTADRVIGFNSLGFDVPALTPYTNFPFNKLFIVKLSLTRNGLKIQRYIGAFNYHNFPDYICR